jgi:hypothetical protein
LSALAASRRAVPALIQRSIAFALAAVVTLAVLGSIDSLASRDITADALLARQVSAAHRTA